MKRIHIVYHISKEIKWGQGCYSTRTGRKAMNIQESVSNLIIMHNEEMNTRMTMLLSK